MKIVLDTSILVRATERSRGLARELLTNIVEGNHSLILSNEILHELSKVLRYPRLIAFYGLSEELVYDYIGYLRQSAEIVPVDQLLLTPTRDVNDAMVIQTAIIGEADVLCAKDDDFFEAATVEYLADHGVEVMRTLH